MRHDARFSTRPLTGLCLAAACMAASIVMAADPPSSCRTLRTMARVRVALGQYDKAQTLAEVALRQARAIDAGDEELALCTLDLAVVYQNRDRLVEARDLFVEGVALQRRTLWKHHPYIAYSLRMLADVYRQMADFDAAGCTLDEAIALLGRTHLPDDPAMWMFQVDRAKLLMDQNLLDEAQAILDPAVEALRNAYGSDHPCTADVLRDRAVLRLRQGRWHEARDDIDESRRFQEHGLDVYAMTLVPAWLIEVPVYYAAGPDAKAESCLLQVLEAVGEDHDVVQGAGLREKIARIGTEAQYASASGTAAGSSDW